MLISHRKQFIYTKTYKTAGTSVEVYFEPYCMPEGDWQEKHLREEYVSEAGVIGYRGRPRDTSELTWWNHMPAELIKARLNNDAAWNSYFKFCVIRNPFDKVISAYHFQNKALPDQPRWYYYQRKVKKVVNQWLYQGVSPAMKKHFKQWLKEGKMFIDRDKYFIDNQLCVDYIIQYEDLEGGIKAVCERLNIPFEPARIPRFKVSNRPKKAYSTYYDQEAIDLVTELFEFEVNYFNYKP
ncbi:MAG: sulfotransferase family protein [Saprospiraceae bacterium]|nr:sulfotransferase family protein [Saprospiraceae bacterium]